MVGCDKSRGLYCIMVFIIVTLTHFMTQRHEKKHENLTSKREKTLNEAKYLIQPSETSVAMLQNHLVMLSVISGYFSSINCSR